MIWYVLDEQPVDFSQQPLLDPNQQLSVCTTYSPNMSSAGTLQEVVLTKVFSCIEMKYNNRM